MFRRLRRVTGDLLFAYMAVITGYWVVLLFRQVRSIVQDTPIPYVDPPRTIYRAYNETPLD